MMTRHEREELRQAVRAVLGGALLVAVALAVLVVGAAVSLGDTYYVAPGGNDTTGTGSEGAPWATLQKAVDTVPNGTHTIRVADGTYGASATLTLSGLSGVGNVIRFEPSGTGYTIQRTNVATTPIISSASFTAGAITFAGATIGMHDAGIVPNQLISHTGAGALTFEDCTLGNSITVSAIFDTTTGTTGALTFDGCTFERKSTAGGAGGVNAMNIWGAGSVTIRDCTTPVSMGGNNAGTKAAMIFYANAAATSSLTIEDSTLVHRNGRPIIAATAPTAAITAITLRDSTLTTMLPAVGAAGNVATISSPVTRLTIDGCTISGENGMALGGGGSVCQVNNTTFSQTGTYGLKVYGDWLYATLDGCTFDWTPGAGGEFLVSFSETFHQTAYCRRTRINDCTFRLLGGVPAVGNHLLVTYYGDVAVTNSTFLDLTDDPNGYCYVTKAPGSVVEGCVLVGSLPLYSMGQGQRIISNTLYCTGTTSGALQFSPTNLSTWAANTAYAANGAVRATTPNGYAYYVSATSGTSPYTSGAGEPTWPTTVGDTVVDNELTWTCYIDVVPGDTVVRDNIIHGGTGTAAVQFQYLGGWGLLDNAALAGTDKRIRFEDNVMYGGATALVRVQGSTGTFTNYNTIAAAEAGLAATQVTFPAWDGCVAADPLFVDAASCNFDLRSSSPARPTEARWWQAIGARGLRPLQVGGPIR